MWSPFENVIFPSVMFDCSLTNLFVPFLLILLPTTNYEQDLSCDDFSIRTHPAIIKNPGTHNVVWLGLSNMGWRDRRGRC